MALRLIEVTAPGGYADTISAVADNPTVLQATTLPTTNKEIVVVRLLTRAQGRQQLMDTLLGTLGGAQGWRISMIPVDASEPEVPVPEEDEAQARRERTNQTREELFRGVSGSAAPSADFFLMTALAAIVAAAGLIRDNTAVVIGAMVIAPLLGPNIALALGASLGSASLTRRGAQSLGAGIALSIVLGFALAYLLGAHRLTHELILRIAVGPESALLALASGAAAALTIAEGTSMSLVGVMVAVALLPPAVTVGITAELHYIRDMMNAFGLLIVNIAAVTLAAQAVFFYRGIRPKTWLEQRVAGQSTILSMVVWVVLLLGVLAAALLLR
jgi:uncharacterized hydrophobic protein (TIGR00341 family)